MTLWSPRRSRTPNTPSSSPTRRLAEWSRLMTVKKTPPLHGRGHAFVKLASAWGRATRVLSPVRLWPRLGPKAVDLGRCRGTPARTAAMGVLARELREALSPTRMQLPLPTGRAVPAPPSRGCELSRLVDPGSQNTNPTAPLRSGPIDLT